MSRPLVGARQVVRGGLERAVRDHVPATVSVSRTGNCMIIEGL
jgi:hypothetical protein